jgi:type IX secretion system PorP/SprF family membrane protein
MVEHDQAGDAGLSWTQVGLNTSVVHALGSQQAISAGFGIGIAQRSFDISKLSFQNQWNGDLYDAALPTQEVFSDQTQLIPLLSAGLNWHIQAPDRRNKLDVGAAAAHLNRPNASFLKDADEPLAMRYTITSMLQVQMHRHWDLIGFVSGQSMAQAQEIVIGGGIRAIVSQEPTNDLAAQFTLALRPGDAIIPAIQVERNAWTLGLSYDINVSDLQIATARKGGFELAAIYRTLPVPSIKRRKLCPIF